MAVELKSLCRTALMEMFERGHPEVIEDLSWLSFVGHDPLSGTLSLAATRDLAKGFRGGFPDLTCRVLDAIAEGDRVACRWRMVGTHRGAFLGFEPTGRRVTLDGICFFRFNGERVAEEWLEYDAFGLLRQIGAVPTMDELRARYAASGGSAGVAAGH